MPQRGEEGERPGAEEERIDLEEVELEEVHEATRGRPPSAAGLRATQTRPKAWVLWGPRRGGRAAAH